MSINQTNILIIGAGLTGLTLAHYLKSKNINFKIIEARNRIGGRILTKYQEGVAPLEKGATWIGKKHTEINKLLQELGIEIFKQELGNTAIYEPISTSPHQLVRLPPNNDPSFRIKGGTSVLIETLAKSVGEDQLHMDQVVKSIEENDNGLVVKTISNSFNADYVISTLPPNLFVSKIKVVPALPNELTKIAHNTHTWMGESIKVGLRFAAPFWKEKNLSGTIVSNVGPIPEMYDHTDFENQNFALKGFLNGSYFSVSKEERKTLVLNQLRKYYGSQVDNYIAYQELVWRNEEHTFAAYNSHVLPHQNNGHHIYQSSFLNGKLLIAGSETAAEFPGYMEGAVRSAKFSYNLIENV